MANIFSEGFDWQAGIADLLTGKWSGQNGGFTTSNFLSATTAFNVGKSLVLNGSNTPAPQCYKILATNYGTLFLGARVRSDSASAGLNLLDFQDTGTNQIEVRTDSNNHWQITRNGTVLATGTGQFLLATWVYVELAVKFSSTTGWAELYVNGALQCSYYGSTGTNRSNANGNTIATANAYANRLVLQGSTFNAQYVDDIYLNDSSDTINNDVWGDTQVYPLMPTGAGHYTQWARGGSAPAATNWQSVNEIPENGDVSYVSGSNVGDTDTYQYGALPASTTAVRAVSPTFFARKAGPGSRHITAHLWNAATEGDAPAPDYNLFDSYTPTSLIMQRNPLTGAPWTVADLTGLQFGPKVSA